MSYAFYLIPRSLNDPLAKARAYAQLPQNSGEFNTGSQDLAKDVQKQLLAAALVEASPHLAPIRFAYTAMIGKYEMTAEQARLCYRQWLLGAQDGGGVEITLYDDLALITVPYSIAPNAGESVVEAWLYLGILQEKGKYVAYDAQLDRFLDLNKDQPTVVQEYAAVSARKVMPEDEFKKPWWKFWSR